MSSPNGPKSGSTPQDDSDLHSNADNPYNAGSPRVDATGNASAGYGVGSNAPIGYYSNPPVSSGGNPHSGGADGWDASAINFNSLYDDVLANRATRGNAVQPNAGDTFADEGYGPDGEGRS